MRELVGADAEALVRSQIEQHRGGIAKVLAPLDARSAVTAWLDTLRAVEEFINLPLCALDDDELEQSILDFRLDELDTRDLKKIQAALAAKFDVGVSNRFVLTVMQGMAIGTAFRQNGFFEAASGFQTIKHAIGYFQSRRRHLVALLYTLPSACRGMQPVQRLDTLNLVLPVVEHSGLTLTGLYQHLMLAKVFPDYRLRADAQGFSGSRQFETLDAMFLEPERASMLEMRTTADATVRDRLEEIDPRYLFSAAELRNDFRLIEAAYAEFDLSSTAFGSVARFTTACLCFCKDNYRVELTAAQFEELAKESGIVDGVRRHLVHQGGDYVANLDEYAPFIAVDGVFIATVTLLSRFAYHWRSVCLNRVRRFQIRSGFILEASVKTALAKQGFAVADIKRIGGNEFDVIATLGDTVYNVQCKNNLVDLSRIETDPAKFARYNRQLDRYYAQALRKEEAREQLLLLKLGLPKVKHVVVSRFPVATDNPRILPFSRIEQFRSRFETLGGDSSVVLDQQ